MRSMMQEWGTTVRKLRKERGLSLEKLAETARIDPGHLSKFERGLAGIGDETRVRLAQALGKRASEIFTYPDTRPAGTTS